MICAAALTIVTVLLTLGAFPASANVGASPTSASFGSIPVGSTGTTTVQLKNSGTASISIWSITAYGGPFAVSGFSVGQKVAAGATVSLTVSFKPTKTGTIMGYLGVSTSASNGWMTVATSGTGVTSTGSLTVSPASLSFGNVPTGGFTTETVTVKNTGNASISISSVTLSGTGLTETGVSSGMTLSAGQSATLSAQFAPKAAGSISGSINIASSATTITIPVTATGIAAQSTTHVVDLTWGPSSSSDVAGYNVYRSTTSGTNFSKIVSSPVKSTTYADDTVLGGVDYYYVVTTVSNEGVESAMSNQTSALVP